jgi:hypothetical protein
MPPHRVLSIIVRIVFGLGAAVAVISLPGSLLIVLWGEHSLYSPVMWIVALTPVVYLVTYAASLACAVVAQDKDPSGRRSLRWSFLPLVGLAWGIMALCVAA